MYVSREARVLTRYIAKENGKLVEPPIVELKSPSPEIHVTEFEVEVLKEAEVSTPIVVVKKKRKLMLLASSSSSLIILHQLFRKRLPVLGSLQRKKRNISLFTMQEHHTPIPRISYV